LLITHHVQEEAMQKAGIDPDAEDEDEDDEDAEVEDDDEEAGDGESRRDASRVESGISTSRATSSPCCRLWLIGV
jgi:hypothetical protein